MVAGLHVFVMNMEEKQQEERFILAHGFGGSVHGRLAPRLWVGGEAKLCVGSEAGYSLTSGWARSIEREGPVTS